MNAHRIETVVEANGTLVLKELPFQEGKAVEVIVLERQIHSTDSLQEEREDWTQLAMESLERGYGDYEPEYSLDLIKEVNPEYEGG